jgi:hypothetical protein
MNDDKQLRDKLLLACIIILVYVVLWAIWWRLAYYG